MITNSNNMTTTADDTKQRPPLDIYVDGACKGNPGPGGWGVWMKSPSGNTKELSGGEASTTNNRMELMAAIQALETVTGTGRVLTINTDSSYVKNGITSWLPGWKAKGWKKADGKPVLNVDLWQRLETAAAGHQVTWKWVKGHAGNEGNERADALANKGVPS